MAEDFVQEAFLRALHHVSELEDMSKKQGRAWLYRTIKNLCEGGLQKEVDTADGKRYHTSNSFAL